MARLASLLDEFQKHFTHKKGLPRTVGIEKEVLVVDAQGRMADMSSTVWPLIEKKAKWPIIYDDFYVSEVTGYSLGEDIVTNDSGIGTLEFILAPISTIQKAEKNMQKLYSSISPFLREYDFVMIGLGHQPVTQFSPEAWNKKQRYDMLQERFGDLASTSTLSAADQVHIDITLDEIIPAFNVFNKLTGFLIALFGNSPIGGNKRLKSKAYREMIWDPLGEDRTGLPKKPFNSLEEYFQFAWDLPCIMTKTENVFSCPDIPFGEFVKDMSEEEAFTRLLYHEACIWFSSRIRMYGTLEIRPCGLQPFDDHMVVPAFCLGLMEMLPELINFMDCFTWEDCYLFREVSARYGLNSKIDNNLIAPYIKELINMSEEGLKKRGNGEGVYIAPLYERIARFANPADEALEIWNRDGISGLVNARRFIL